MGLEVRARPREFAGLGSDPAGLESGVRLHGFVGWCQTSRVWGLGSDLAGLETGVRPCGFVAGVNPCEFVD
jgi:hypothetical protein